MPRICRVAVSSLLAVASLAVCAPHALAQKVLLPHPFPFPQPTLYDGYTQITAGGYHTCARRYLGATYCWGLDDSGQVGVGTLKKCSGHACVDKPTLVTQSAQVEAGFDHTCALSSAGAASCWGDNWYGQLGVGGGPLGGYGALSVPAAVTGGLAFSSIGAGTYSTCGTTPGGMYCWGLIPPSTAGQTPTTFAAPVNIFAWNGYQSVSVGYAHACAHYSSSWGSPADCWGMNDSGQAGFDPTQLRVVPATIGTLLGGAVSTVSTQHQTTCADQASGVVQCFGANSWGQLGNGGTASTWVPQTVGGGMALHGVSTGMHHACALDPAGAAWCWGNGYNGEVGNGGSGVYPTPQRVTGGLTFRAIAAGAYHTCAIGTDDQLYCWGNGYYGQLGTQGPAGWVPYPVHAITP